MQTNPAIVAAALWVLAAGAVWGGDARPTVAGHQREVPKAAAKSTPAKQAVRPAMTDAQLEAAIRAKFAKSKIAEDKFQVHVQGGVATIEGRTDVIQHKGTATRMAKTAGALAVSNHVQASAAAKEKAAANLEKGRRRAQIKRSETPAKRSDAR
ncbi:MAG TPA: BON domain-containing protein [Bryobacteraceae bacterium]|jgi:hypothetical protein